MLEGHIRKKKWPENHQNTCQFLRPVLGVRSFYDFYFIFFFIKFIHMYDIHIFIFYYFFFISLSVPLKRSRTYTFKRIYIWNIMTLSPCPEQTSDLFRAIETSSLRSAVSLFGPDLGNVWKIHITHMNYNFFLNSVITVSFSLLHAHMNYPFVFSMKNSIWSF